MTYHFAGIDHVQLAAPKGSEELARHFYHTVLGLEELPKPAELASRGGVWFQCGAQQLHIGIEEPFVPAKKAHPAIYVRGLAILKHRLQDSGIEVRKDTNLPDMTRFYVDDPFGNRLEFLERNNS
ncbi:VOC family protein [Brevibacillus humidisoli]|uniref:VOC family protein n=1 Tax=Brevibacillus humidisoli TaxID=2895522 RepID=UPI001E341171|nr:VOC family protein [Brevibacillus humidisoli]UFJ42896.1 VOC family protein [Brevibacillus humidisoli]